VAYQLVEQRRAEARRWHGPTRQMPNRAVPRGAETA
jgi:hypothetical protein